MKWQVVYLMCLKNFLLIHNINTQCIYGPIHTYNPRTSPKPDIANLVFVMTCDDRHF